MKKDVLICNNLKNVHFIVMTFSEDCGASKRKAIPFNVKTNGKTQAKPEGSIFRKAVN